MNYITTPIYYANGEPHIGSAYTTLAADILARFWRDLKKQDTFLLTGMDEHGAKIAQAAEKAGQEPQGFVDAIAKQFELAWQELNIKPDGFIRTTNKNHEKLVGDFLQTLYDKGAIYKGAYKGWYCVGCEEFKTETQIGPNNTCPIHLTALTEVEEEAYLFKLSEYKEQIVDAITSDKLKIRPIARKNEVLGFIQHEGLRDVAISRKNVAWGIPVSWDTDHTVYVWVDALLNYLSAAEGGVFDKKPHWPPSLQLIGKDILRFHAIIWPGLLLATGKDLPQELFVHGYFTIGGHKISKSLGNVILPQELVARYATDATRFLLISAVPFGSDGDISWERLDASYATNLANNIGNLVNRVQAMLTKYRDDKIPTGYEKVSLSQIAPHIEAYNQDFGNYNLSSAADRITGLADTLNEYIQVNQPWELAKSDDKKLDGVLATLAESLVALAVLCAPILPETSRKILSIFGTSISEIDYGTLGKANYASGKIIQPVEPLFPRLDD